MSLELLPTGADMKSWEWRDWATVKSALVAAGVGDLGEGNLATLGNAWRDWAAVKAILASGSYSGFCVSCGPKVTISKRLLVLLDISGKAGLLLSVASSGGFLEPSELSLRCDASTPRWGIV